MIHAAIVHDPIRNEDVLSHVGSEQDGAAILFLGMVRDHADGRPVTGMTYEAYEEMAQPVLLEIAREASERIGSDRVAVVHRVGDLAIGEVSVAIAVSSPHRAEAYDASRYVIEEIKKRLPVWKKEHYADGAPEWVEGTVPPAGKGGSATAGSEQPGSAPAKSARAASSGSGSLEAASARGEEVR